MVATKKVFLVRISILKNIANIVLLRIEFRDLAALGADFGMLKTTGFPDEGPSPESNTFSFISEGG